jgi:D-lactate dehydrogenase
MTEHDSKVREQDEVDLLSRLGGVVDVQEVLSTETDMAFYTRGMRFGRGRAFAVVLPRTLLALWRVLQVCVDSDAIILMQAAKTGVTGGSTPYGSDYGRRVVIVSTRYLNGVQVIDDARQAIAFPGTTLTELENALRPLGREPHSVIGSSCIGASVVGGICNNSGGSLVRRGPAFTEKSLFARIDADGKLSLVNSLGIALGDEPEQILANLAEGSYIVGQALDWEGRTWADDYADKLRDISADTPARYNGDPTYLCESAGCSGKLAVFAVRVPTFEALPDTVTFYLGSNSEEDLVALRRFLLVRLSRLPIQAEYIHRNAFDLTVRYAKHIYKAIRRLGPERLPDLIQKKAQWEKSLRALRIFPSNSLDRLIQLRNRLTPHGLPRRLADYRTRFEHHLMIKVEKRDAEEMRQLLEQFLDRRTNAFFECTASEARDAFLLRFSVGACTLNYCDAHGIETDERLVAFDVALRRNDLHWRLELPAELREQVQLEACCGHFFCFVNHQDYVLKPGYDVAAFKLQAMAYLSERGARYPAEHNVGHLYQATPAYVEHMRALDPTNSFNPGIGKTSRKKFWK